MTPLYWIEGFQEYDQEMFKSGLIKFAELVEPIAEKHGLKIKYISISELFFGYSEKPCIYYRGEDLLQTEAYVYIPYTNPHPQTERLLHSLSRIAAASPKWTQINDPAYLDRDKEQAFQLASLIGAKTIPSWLIPHRTTSRTQINLIEKMVGSYPYIVKPTSMLAGIGIVKVDNRDSLCSILDFCAQSPRTYLIQPFIKDASDCRIYLENHRVIACQMRSPPPEGFLSNISQRGTGLAVKIAPEIEAFSIALAKRLTDGYLCIDWLITKKGAYLSEIDFSGMFFGLPEPERTDVIHAFFRSMVKMPGRR